MRMWVEVQNADLVPGLPQAEAIESWVNATVDGCTTENPERRALCVRYVDQSEGQALNLAHRGQDQATNVLSFPAEIPEVMQQALAANSLNVNAGTAEPVLPLGDLVLCVPVISQQAQDQGKQLADHVAHLVVHGVLHLLGHDHQEDAQALIMENHEIRVLASFGIANPYEYASQAGLAS